MKLFEIWTSGSEGDVVYAQRTDDGRRTKINHNSSSEPKARQNFEEHVC